MKKKEFGRVVRELDAGKTELLKQGVAFNLISIMEGGEAVHLCTGGTTEQIAMLLMHMNTFYRNSTLSEKSPEEFAEYIGKLFANAVEKNAFKYNNKKNSTDETGWLN